MLSLTGVRFLNPNLPLLVSSSNSTQAMTHVRATLAQTSRGDRGTLGNHAISLIRLLDITSGCLSLLFLFGLAIDLIRETHVTIHLSH